MPARLPVVRVKPGRDRSLRHRHPWLFSGAIAAVEGEPASGATVEVRAADGDLLALAAWSPASQIRARVWSFAPTSIDASFIAMRLQKAIAARAGMLDARHNGVRIVHGESDGLPGVVADRYADVVVVQLLSAGAEAWRDAIVDALADATPARAIVERSDADVRALEGLAPRIGVVRGTLPEPVVFRENGVDYAVDVLAGQKTGFYLDQRDNRRIVGDHATGRQVLNAFCYTGGFTLACLAGGANTRRLGGQLGTGACPRAGRISPATPRSTPRGRSGSRPTCSRSCAACATRARSFDLIVLDPPKFAPTAHHAERAARAYKDINLLALKLLAPGGYLATFSCSGGIGAELFQKIVAGAAQDARADAAIVGRFAASADHPVALAFPEGEYLKGLLVRKA